MYRTSLSRNVCDTALMRRSTRNPTRAAYPPCMRPKGFQQLEGREGLGVDIRTHAWNNGGLIDRHDACSGQKDQSGIFLLSKQGSGSGSFEISGALAAESSEDNVHVQNMTPAPVLRTLPQPAPLNVRPRVAERHVDRRSTACRPALSSVAVSMAEPVLSPTTDAEPQRHKVAIFVVPPPSPPHASVLSTARALCSPHVLIQCRSQQQRCLSRLVCVFSCCIALSAPGAAGQHA